MKITNNNQINFKTIIMFILTSIKLHYRPHRCHQYLCCRHHVQMSVRLRVWYSTSPKKKRQKSYKRMDTLGSKDHHPLLILFDFTTQMSCHHSNIEWGLLVFILSVVFVNVLSMLAHSAYIFCTFVMRVTLYWNAKYVRIVQIPCL